MPTILGGLDRIAWFVIAYTLTTAISTPTWSEFGVLFAGKHVFLTLIEVFHEPAAPTRGRPGGFRPCWLDPSSA